MSENRGAPQVTRTTPGPWRVVEHEPTKYRIRGHVGPIEVDVAEVYGGPYDAHLVASAPDLRDLITMALALKGGWREAIVELEDHCSEPVRLKNMLAAADQLDEWAAKARAAITKASAP